MHLALIAFFFRRDKTRHPNFDALALSPTLGWLLLATMCCLVLYFIAHRDKWRRLWLSVGDPRSIALFRICFGIMTLCNVNGLYELWEYLFTEDGIFTTGVAQQVRARGQFAGYGDGSTPGEVLGFFSFDAFVQWAKGPNYSLLLFNSSKTFFWIHMAVFELAMLAFIVGWQTKWTKWVAWFMFHSVILRNTIYWEGTENVYRSFFFLLCLSRCGSAYSVDNWLRCRRLRRAGKLSEPGGPGEGCGLPPVDGEGALAPIYRAVPMWPRYLMMIQTAIVYGYAGPTKNGPTWHAGDGFYYAANLDHFYRFPPQQLSAIFGTNLFRLNSHIAHYWQMFFPVVLLGLVLRWVKREKMPPLEGWRRIMARLAALGVAAGFLAMTLVAYPVHYAPKKGQISVETVQWIVGLAVPVGLGLLAWIGYRIWSKPFVIRLAGRELVIEVEGVGRWLFGRRVWLGLGFIFHLHLVLLLNVGWFNPGLACSYIAFFNGSELAAMFAEFKIAFATALRKPAAYIESIRPIGPQDPALGMHWDSGTKLGFAPLFVCLAWALMSAVRHAATLPDFWKPVAGVIQKRWDGFPTDLLSQGGHVHAGWFFVCMAAFLLTLTLRRQEGWKFDARYALPLALLPLAWSFLVEAQWLHMRWSVGLVVLGTWLATRAPTDAPEEDHLERPPAGGYAYAGLGRVIAGGLLAYHLAGLAAWMLPQKDSMGTFRIEAREPFKAWITTTQNTQSWSMFAPNPPKSNLFMKVQVVADGERWDLNTDVYACFEEGLDSEVCDEVFPIPWVSYTRQRKINRRVAGSEGGGGAWYQKWHARWVCREWAKAHDGVPPEKVELIKVTYRIPTPEAVRDKGPYDPRTRYLQTRQDKDIYTAHCGRAPFGELDNRQRVDAGFEVDPDLEGYYYEGWQKERCKNWNKKLAREAKAEGREPESVKVDCIDQEVFEATKKAKQEFKREQRAKRDTKPPTRTRMVERRDAKP
jgi:hypothetical protein